MICRVKLCGAVWVLGLLAGVCGAGWGQTLAHKNWAGSGISVAPWWQGAALYEIDPIDFADADGDGFGDLRGLAGRLDYVQALGVDAVVISSMPLRVGGGNAQPFDLVYGTVDDFDHLVAAAAARKMRVVVDLPLRADEGVADMLAAGRFWLSRGVAGLRVVAGPGAPVSAAVAAERTRELRRLCVGFAGQRVVLSAIAQGGADTAVAVARRGRGSAGAGAGGAEAGAQMVEDTRLLGARTLGDVRGALRAGAGGAEKVLVTDADGVPRSWDRLAVAPGVAGEKQGAARAAAKALAAVLLLAGGSSGSSLVYFGQELGMTGAGGPEPMQWGAAHPFTTGTPWIEMGPNAGTANVEAEEGDADSLLQWYRRLGELRHGSAALRSGSVETLPMGSQNGGADVMAWVRRARLGEREAAPVVVMVNLSPYAVAVNPVAGNGGAVAAGGLRVLATTFPMASQTVGSGPLALPGFGVFVGEVRKAAGLETVVIPPRTRRR